MKHMATSKNGIPGYLALCLAVCFAVTLFGALSSKGELIAQDEAASSPNFLEGFPDVPLLPFVTGTLVEPVVFDTPSGTVATISLAVSVSYDEAARAYSAALRSLGWACEAAESLYVCSREGSRLSLSELRTDAASAAIAMRLEPQ